MTGRAIVFAGLLLFASARVDATSKEWSWLASAFAPCENVGIHGAYRVIVKATVTPASNGVVVSNLSAKATSGIFTQTDNETFTLSVGIIRNGAETNVTVFGPQPTGTIGPAPGPDESRTRYAPANVKLTVPAGAKLRFHAAASVPLEGGLCSLGADDEDIDPAV